MTLTRVAAFGRWRKRGYRVRAGEKGLRIFGPVTRPPDLTGRACHGRCVSHGWIKFDDLDGSAAAGTFDFRLPLHPIPPQIRQGDHH